MSCECETCGEHIIDCCCKKHGNRNPHSKYRPEWGFHNLMVLAAFRYCLGRQSYIVSCCTEWLTQYWPVIDDDNKKLIDKEIREAIEGGWVGDQCDKQNWEKILQLGSLFRCDGKHPS